MTKHDDLRKMLLIQMQNIFDPEENMNVKDEIQKAKQLCELSQTILDIDKVEIMDRDATTKEMNVRVNFLDKVSNFGIVIKNQDLKKFLKLEDKNE